MTCWLFVGGTRVDDAADGVDALAEGRGLAYGDGLFETMRAVAGTIPWWPAHRARLHAGAARLRIAPPPAQALEDALAHLLAQRPDGVVKLILTRGRSGRGYAAASDAAPTWLLSAGAAPPSQAALRLRWCETRLAIQPALAGLKHCNRLEQVLARSEWSDPSIDEGLMRDTDGHAVCATAGNLFALHGTVWSTPPVDRCGVAGICRGWALDALPATVRALSVAEVEAADALILCNAVRGILPVARLGDRIWSPHPAIAEARRRLAAAHPAFVRGSESDSSEVAS